MRSSVYQPINLIVPSEGLLGPILLGDSTSPIDVRASQTYQIKTVITVGADAFPPEQKLPKTIQSHFKYEICDNKLQKVSATLLDQVCVRIEEGRKVGGVLVHCFAGVSRSPAFVIAYLMWKKATDYDKAKDLVRKMRNCIQPGDVFIRGLMNYGKVLINRRLAEEEEEAQAKLKVASKKEIESITDNSMLILPTIPNIKTNLSLSSTSQIRQRRGLPGLIRAASPLGLSMQSSQFLSRSVFLDETSQSNSTTSSQSPTHPNQERKYQHYSSINSRGSYGGHDPRQFPMLSQLLFPVEVQPQLKLEAKEHVGSIYRGK